MPMKPKPYTLVCEECGWKKTVAPRSDSLKRGEWFDQCPKCGSKVLKMQAAGWFEGVLAEFLARRRF